MRRQRISARQRRHIIERAQGCCEYCLCQAAFATQSLSVEHILPIHLGGDNSFENLALACQGCNSHKHTKQQGIDPVDGAPVPLFHPRRQQWQEHFCWSEDYTLIIGISPVGRATVEALKMNRPGLINLRRVLYALGEHPPVHVRPE
jgi:hypothetical protein